MIDLRIVLLGVYVERKDVLPSDAAPPVQLLPPSEQPPPQYDEAPKYQAGTGYHGQYPSTYHPQYGGVYNTNVVMQQV